MQFTKEAIKAVIYANDAHSLHISPDSLPHLGNGNPNLLFNFAQACDIQPGNLTQHHMRS